MSYRFKLLTISGAFATILMATVIYGLGSWKYTMPVLAFFVLSSLLSKIRKTVRKDVEEYFEKSGTRDFGQVFANGGTACIILLLNELIVINNVYQLYVASLCIVAADTWATEIGTIKKTRTYNIRNFKLTKQGTSGGVSVIGTIGALFGASSVSLSAVIWIGESYTYFLGTTIIVGVLGSLLDSLLGSTFQAQYICNQCKKITERYNHCNTLTSFYSGVKWINNDRVNFFASLFGVIILLLLYHL